MTTLTLVNSYWFNAGGGGGGTGFSITDILLHGGGTHNAVNYSPNGDYAAAFADVGGVRMWDSASDRWQYKPCSSDNDDRQVVGFTLNQKKTKVIRIFFNKHNRPEGDHVSESTHYPIKIKKLNMLHPFNSLCIYT